jgi:hypothetical protein
LGSVEYSTIFGTSQEVVKYWELFILWLLGDISGGRNIEATRRDFLVFFGGWRAGL